MRRMHLGTRLALPTLVAASLALPTPAGAAEPTATTMTVTATPSTQYADNQVTLGIDLVDEAGQPVTGAVVTEDGTAETYTTDEAGHVDVVETMPRQARGSWSFSYAGDDSHQGAHVDALVPVKRRSSKVTVTGPSEVVDEQSIDLTVR